MGGIAKPHDRLFKHLLERPASAQALLFERLAPELSALLAREPPTLVAGSLVTDDLAGARADRVLRAPLASGEGALYCIVEHQSRPDRLMVRRLLTYLSQHWWQLGKSRKKADSRSVTTAMIVYNGREAWHLPTSFQEALGLRLPPGAGQSLIDFHYPLVSLGALSDNQLSAEPGLRAGLMAMKYGTRPERQTAVLPRLVEAASDVPELEYSILRYIFYTFDPLLRSALVDISRRVRPETRKVMRSIADEYRREGEKEGRKEGKKEGVRKGEAKLLVHLLARRFGSVPPARKRQVMGASEAELTRWSERLLGVDELEAVFR